MSVERLITEHLDLWTSAVTYSRDKPELTGIAKLRELILELAVRGKLVPQDPEDEPASKLLERIEEEKARLCKEGKIKKPSNVAEIEKGEKPFEIPEGWEWARLEELCSYLQRGKSPAYAEHGNVKAVSQKCVQWRGFSVDPARWVSDDSLANYRPERFLREGDVLWNSTGTGTVGRVVSLANSPDPRMVADSHVTVLRFVGVSPGFTVIFLKSPSVQDRIDPGNPTPLVSGTTKQVELNTRQVRNLPVPVPPAEEESRIAERVAELMAICDRLEQQTSDQLQAHETLVDTLLDTLTRSQDATELAENWALLADHFDTLFTTEHSIDRLEQTILQLAVMGRLVPQQSTEESASKLIEHIAAIKEQLPNEGGIKKPKKRWPIKGEEEAFTLPVGWSWGRLENICEAIVDCPHSTPKFTSSGYLCLDTNSFKSGCLVNNRLRYVDLRTFQERIRRLKPRSGDIVFAREGTVGEAFVIPNNVECCLGQRVMLFRPGPGMSSEFVRYAITAPFAIEQLTSLHKGIGAKHVNVGDMRNYVIGVPPKEEQERIVGALRELFALCERLKRWLNQAVGVQREIAEGIVMQAAV